MATIVEAISVTNAVELLSVVWVEVTMASLAAMVWFTVTGTVIMPKGSKKFDHDQSQGKKSPRSSNANGEQALSLQLATKALRQGKLHDAVATLQQLPESGSIPASIAPRLLLAVAKAENFDQALTEVTAFAGKIEGRAFEAVILEAVKNKDMSACRQLMALSTPLSIPKSARALETLARAFSSDVDTLRTLVDEAEAPLAKGFAGAVLEACAALREVDLAMDVFEKAAETDAAALRVVAEKASQSACKPAADKPSKPSKSAADKDGSTPAKDIRNCGKNGNLDAALTIFEQASSHAKNTFLYNTILEACVECADVKKAVHFFKEAGSKGCVDVVSYNTMMKGYLAQGKETEAAQLLQEISEKGLTATHSSYHGLLNARVSAQDRKASWKIVDSMQAGGIAPNMITCSILLKSKANAPSDIERILKLVDATEQQMDEILFATVVEACARANCLDALSKQTAKFARQGGALALTAQTYGSMIKAYGQMWDVKRVWQLWGEMTSNNVQPTAITLGCMVEALVSNRHTADAWKLVQQMLSEESTRSLVNTVIYSTILKGFANMKEVAKVMELYEKMKANGLQANTITYNTILNAFAQTGAMDRVPALLEDMKTGSPAVEMDIVTYSTIVKGFCNSGSLDRALKIMEEMQAIGKYQADEVMYNSLLDGCAKEHRPDDALKLIQDMKQAGVPPSNYTLSMLVKLMGRCRRINQAFSLIEEISSEYGLKINIQVYTCLIQACFNNRQAFKAIAVHDRMIKEGLLPDEMTYSSLVKGCLQAGLVDKASQLAKSAYGIGLSKGKSTHPGLSDRCLDELLSSLGREEARELKAQFAECQVLPRKGSGKGSYRGIGAARSQRN